VNFHELGQIELRRLEDLDLADVHVLQRVDARARLFNLLANDFRDELEDKFLQVAGVALTVDDFNHLGANSANLGALRVARALRLVDAALGETDAKDAKGVTIGRLDVGEALDEGEPLADERADLIRGEVHTGKVGQDVSALDVFALELHLAERLVLVVVEVREGDLKDAALQAIGSNLSNFGKTSATSVNHSNDIFRVVARRARRRESARRRRRLPRRASHSF